VKAMLPLKGESGKEVATSPTDRGEVAWHSLRRVFENIIGTHHIVHFSLCCHFMLK
jgi:hypothetical protein